MAGRPWPRSIAPPRPWLSFVVGHRVDRLLPRTVERRTRLRQDLARRYPRPALARTSRHQAAKPRFGRGPWKRRRTVLKPCRPESTFHRRCGMSALGLARAVHIGHLRRPTDPDCVPGPQPSLSQKGDDLSGSVALLPWSRSHCWRRRTRCCSTKHSARRMSRSETRPAPAGTSNVVRSIFSIVAPVATWTWG